MIVATAGHIDHGKTTLVKALTGVDADRLPEEKRRGMTIDLGFAYLGETGFVDVPGHERFVHNMLAGVSGIDLALLVVAADDGPMPQTLEHLAIVRLLGVPRIAAVVTKVDRVPKERIAEVAEQVASLLPGAPVLPVSAVRGDGLHALRDYLRLAAAKVRARASAGNFRLSVDRAFTLPGAGLVVTGTAMSGAIAAGERVRALLCGTQARVRAIHAQGASAPRGHAGQRLALNLAGFDGRAPIRRGEWIVAGALPEAVRRFDARLECPAPCLAPRAPVHLHLGAAHTMARVMRLDAHGLVQVLCDEPVGALRGDRFIVRDASARRTLGGGMVIDVFPPARGRARPERIAWLEAMAIEDDDAALAALAECSPRGVSLARFAANRNRPAAAGWRFAPARWRALREQALAELAAAHERAPHAPGVPEARVLEDARIPREAAAKLIDELLAEGRIVRERSMLRLARHQAQMSAADAALWQRLRPLLERADLRPPTLAELAPLAGGDARALEAALARLERLGCVVRVSKSRFFLPGALRRLRAMVLELSPITAGALRDRAGFGRGVAIEVLEYFDRTGLTRRVGDVRLLRDREIGHTATSDVELHAASAGRTIP